MSDYRLGLRDAEGAFGPYEATVEGEVPAWLSGALLRNGPGRFAVGDRTVNHWFDGYALLRRWTIRDGAVEYAHRFLDSDAYRGARAGRMRYGEFGTLPDDGYRGHLRRLLSGELTDNASIGVEFRDGRFLATTEPPRAHAFGPGTLETLATREHDPGVDTAGTTAHRHHDPRRDETWAVGTRFPPGGGYSLVRIPAPGGAGDPEVVATVDRDRIPYLHSFALTDRYAVVVEPPFVLSPTALLRRQSFREGHEWRPDRGTRAVVLERATGEVVADRRVDPFFVYHHANAYEVDAEGEPLPADGPLAGEADGPAAAVVCDLVAFPDDRAVADLELDRLRDPDATVPAGDLRRLRIPLDGPAPSVERIADAPSAFPTVDYERRVGRRHRYVYGGGVGDRPARTLADRIVKVDVETGDVTTWRQADAYPGEPLFVPRPGGAEDEGVLLSVVLDAAAERTALVVLDAATMTERARATLPRAVPFGFHGQFYRLGGRPLRSMA